jgi:hypothetical protein
VLLTVIPYINERHLPNTSGLALAYAQMVEPKDQADG